MPPVIPPVHPRRARWSGDTAWLAYLSIATIIVHLLTGDRYGFHRDELAVFDDARHLAWGYVVYPPVTLFFARVALTIFGTSLVGFRFFAAVVQALAVFLAGLMARELGGKREAQILASLAAVPFCLGAGALMQYISFDYICWVLTAYCMIRLLRSDDPRWLLAGGAAIGLGMLSKYTMAFFVCGVLGGMLLTPARRYLVTKWFWAGLVAAVQIFLPNLLWQFHHHFVSLYFLRFLHERDVTAGLTKSFLPDQLQQTLLAVPLWVAGLWFYFFSTNGRRFRALGWMYVITLLLFVIAKGRGYYLAPAYPMLYAAGAVVCEDFFSHSLSTWSKALRPALWTALLISDLGAMAIALPIAPIKSRWWYAAAQIDSALPEEIGWPEFVATLAQIRDSLPLDQRARVGILAGNYGEVGAINLFGPRYGLPPAISGVNSSWERGYGDPPPVTIIIAGFWKEFVDDHFTSCRVAARVWNSYGIENEETFEHPFIFVCGPPLKGWPDFWKDFQMFARRTNHATATIQASVIARAAQGICFSHPCTISLEPARYHI
jgi:4-amino-4-deoxy-L-arabinose transferase-like glycosyltransferase